MSSPIPVSMPDDMLAEIRELARETHLSQQDVIRQSAKLGMSQLRNQLGKGRLLNVEPLSDAVLKKLYRNRDDDPEGIDALMAAQPIGKGDE